VLGAGNEDSLPNLSPGLCGAYRFGPGLGLHCQVALHNHPGLPTPHHFCLVESVLSSIQKRIRQWRGAQREWKFKLVLGGGALLEIEAYD
jgi:hypothetical protein